MNQTDKQEDLGPRPSNDPNEDPAIAEDPSLVTGTGGQAISAATAKLAEQEDRKRHGRVESQEVVDDVVASSSQNRPRRTSSSHQEQESQVSSSSSSHQEQSSSQQQSSHKKKTAAETKTAAQNLKDGIAPAQAPAVILGGKPVHTAVLAQAMTKQGQNVAEGAKAKAGEAADEEPTYVCK